MAEMSEYELQRLEHIRRNQECGHHPSPHPSLDPPPHHRPHRHSRARARRRYLQRLGLADGEWSKLLSSAPPGKPAPKPRKKKAKPAPVDAASCRRSGRIKKEKPEYSGIRYDSFFERLAQDSDSDEEGRGATAIKREKKRRRPAGPKRSEEEVEAEREAILANSKNWLERSRQALLRIEGPNTRSTPTTEEEWHAVAVQRWGEQVGPEAGEGAAEVAEGEWSWERFVASRVSTPPKPSPDPLLQVRICPPPPRRLPACLPRLPLLLAIIPLLPSA